MQKTAFACLLGEYRLPVFESWKAKNSTFLFLFRGLVLAPEVGPVLDK
jgi:hypothetical protein